MTAQKRKDQAFGKIQEKRQAGEPISSGEARYEKKYLGISDSNKVPQSISQLSGDDWDKTLKVAKDFALSSKIKSKSDEMGRVGSSTEEIASEIEFMKSDKNVTMNEAIGGLDEALKFRFPNIPEAERQKVVESWAKKAGDRWVEPLGVSLPENIGTIPQAHEFLVAQGMDPTVAAQLLNENVKWD